MEAIFIVVERLARKRHLHSSIFGELHGIAEQVDDYLAQTGNVADKAARQFSFELEAHFQLFVRGPRFDKV